MKSFCGHTKTFYLLLLSKYVSVILRENPCILLIWNEIELHIYGNQHDEIYLKYIMTVSTVDFAKSHHGQSECISSGCSDAYDTTINDMRWFIKSYIFHNLEHMQSVYIEYQLYLQRMCVEFYKYHKFSKLCTFADAKQYLYAINSIAIEWNSQKLFKSNQALRWIGMIILP